MLKKSIPQQKSNAVESNSEVELKGIYNRLPSDMHTGLYNLDVAPVCQNSKPILKAEAR